MGQHAVGQSVQWGSVRWGSVQWGSARWGSARWGPAGAHRDDSCVGLQRPRGFCSQMLLAVALPMAVSTTVSSRGQSSRSRERTRDTWVPKLRWIPEHSMQISAPTFRLAHVGSAGGTA